MADTKQAQVLPTLQCCADAAGHGGMVLLIHGMDSTKETWRPVLDQCPLKIAREAAGGKSDDAGAAAAATAEGSSSLLPPMRVAVDLVGHGQTETAADLSIDVQVAALVATLDDVQAKLALPGCPVGSAVPVIGHSMGARVATSLAARTGSSSSSSSASGCRVSALVLEDMDMLACGGRAATVDGKPVPLGEARELDTPVVGEAAEAACKAMLACPRTHATREAGFAVMAGFGYDRERVEGLEAGGRAGLVGEGPEWNCGIHPYTTALSHRTFLQPDFGQEFERAVACLAAAGVPPATAVFQLAAAPPGGEGGPRQLVGAGSAFNVERGAVAHMLTRCPRLNILYFDQAGHTVHRNNASEFERVFMYIWEAVSKRTTKD